MPGPKARSSAADLISVGGVSGLSLQSSNRPSLVGFTTRVRILGRALKGNRISFAAAACRIYGLEAVAAVVTMKSRRVIISVSLFETGRIIACG